MFRDFGFAAPSKLDLAEIPKHPKRCNKRGRGPSNQKQNPTMFRDFGFVVRRELDLGEIPKHRGCKEESH